MKLVFRFDEAAFLRLVASAVTLMGVLTDEQRVWLMSALRIAWCDGCGVAQPDVGLCQCKNDE